MMGLSLAPATGRIVANLLEEEEPGVDLRLMDPERFG
jgi:glycine/D-amino acid oxidase-like deaminating enzyme